MDDYLSYFFAARTVVFAGAALLLALGGTWLLRRRLPGRARKAGFIGLVFSIGLILYVTVLREPPQGSCPTCLLDWGLDRLHAGALGTDMQLNILLFVPAAFFATLLWRHPFRVTGIAVLVSLSIEIIQPLVGVGVNDVLDIMANTLGALAGAWLAWVVLLVHDWITTRRLDTHGAIRAVVTLLVVVAVCWGGSAAVATQRQVGLANQLEGGFAGTTLADYQRWEATDTLCASPSESP